MIPDPYIPEQVVDPEDFVGRCKEIENFKIFLDLGIFLSRLTEKDLIKKVERGQYQLFHPLFKEYLKNLVIGGGSL
jgi:hypothetical protein